MGSSFSVVNDTGNPIWVSHGVCKAALFGSIAGVLAVSTAGAVAAALVASTGDAEAVTAVFELEGLVMTQAVVRVTLEASTVGGLITAAEWSALGTVSCLLVADLGITAGLVGKHREKVMSVKRRLQRESLKRYIRVEPDDKYTVKGTLPLVLTAYVIYNNGKRATHDCWTGLKPGSENEYPVTEYF